VIPTNDSVGLEQSLMTTFGFNEAVLRENRAGQMSQNQVTRLQEQQKRLLWRTPLVVFLVVLCPIVVATTTNMLIQAIFGAGFVFLVFPAILLIQDFLQITFDLRDSRVISTTGSVARTPPIQRKRYTVYFDSMLGRAVTINGVYFWLPEALWITLDDPYYSLTVYYLPHSKTVLSMELVD
jgi:hypothetical protein